MCLPKGIGDYSKGFSKLNLEGRFARLLKIGAVKPEQINYLREGGLKDTTLGEKFVENVIGYMQIPLGVATNFKIDNKEYVIPMAVEETSIIASASKTARWVKEQGDLTAYTIGNTVIGQIQISQVKDIDQFETLIKNNAPKFIEMANSDIAASMVKRGGGVKEIKVRRVAKLDGTFMGIVHVHVDTCDAMGANIINQICEFLKEPIEVLTEETVTMCILSNYVDSKITCAKLTIRNIDPETGRKIEEASIFAEQDPYRATTNNKGVVNGIDPILIATGNDWRAVESAIHAYAAKDGRYRSITKWRVQDRDLVGTFAAPIIVGIVGGVTNLHPTAKMCIEMLGLESAQELSRICAAVGLVQNLGALKALTSEGITQGHMRLHIKNLAFGTDAVTTEIPILQRKLEEALKKTKRVSMSLAKEILKELRSGTKGRTKASASI